MVLRLAVLMLHTSEAHVQHFPEVPMLAGLACGMDFSGFPEHEYEGGYSISWWV